MWFHLALQSVGIEPPRQGETPSPGKVRIGSRLRATRGFFLQFFKVKTLGRFVMAQTEGLVLRKSTVSAPDYVGLYLGLSSQSPVPSGR